jgi:23S rRNA pseudouridine2605 synthase
VSTRDDPQGRPTVYDLLPRAAHAVQHVGRLDYESEGLLLLTNDGDGANRLMHPRYGVERVYEVKVRAVPGRHRRGAARRACSWTMAPRVPCAAATGSPRCRGRLRLAGEGRKREVRRMFDAGPSGLSLRRVRYGPVEPGRAAPW